MAKCDACGSHENMPYQCRRCGQTFCAAHRLPENHDCPGLDEWNDPGGVFDSGFDDSVESRGRTSKAKGIVDKVTGTGGPLSYFRGNMAYTMLAAMWITFLLQWFTILVGGGALHQTLFVLRPAFPEYVWTWVTSVFAHSPTNFLHIVFNSMVIFFFGPLVERYVGSKKFALLFVVSGVLAGLSQTLLTIFETTVTPTTPGVLGASGAALAIMGVLTVLNPKLKVLIYFIIPAPIWLLTLGTAAVSVFFIGTGQAGGAGIAHGAHLVGLAVGLAYGQYVKRTQNIRTQNRFRLGGGGPGGPGGGMGGPGRGRF
ncbi:MAG: rhomboid family intramembrane serine protease [Euryarchaeota archaeon]|nr:rhomboid family intramembrane serine protease [Euryarchaeota archaeon]